MQCWRSSSIRDGDNTLLTAAIAELDERTQKESFWFDGWDGIADDRVRQLVDQNRVKETPNLDRLGEVLGRRLRAN